MKKISSEVAAMDSPCAFFLFLLCILFTYRPVTSSTGPTISYANHCAYMVPEAAPTTQMYTVYPFLEPQTSYFSGGERILGKNTLFGGARSLNFAATTNIFMTEVDGLYKIEARLLFQTHNANFYALFNTTLDWPSSNHTRHRRRRRSIDFLLNGFWSVTSKKLCMVGSAPWYSIGGKSINLESVLKLNFSRKLTVHTSLINGVLESLASSTNDPSYFEPISILGFPRVTPDKYNYTLVSDESCSGGNLPLNSSLRLNVSSICDMFSGQFTTYNLRYPSGCKSVNSSLNCTPFGPVSGNLPPFLSLYAIQCSQSERKLRYLVGFPKSRYFGYRSSFDPNTTLIAEGAWDARKNQLCLVLCRILLQDDLSGNAHPGDCSIRLTLRYRAVWSIRNRISVEGEIWTNKTANDVGYFEKIKFQSIYNGMINLPGLKYEYTEMERVKKLCPMRKPLEKKGETYADGNSPGMRFDMYISDSKQNLGWGFADPISLGSQFYDAYTGVIRKSSKGYATVGGFVVPEVDGTVYPVVEATHSSGPMNISYKISFRPSIGFKLGTGISSLNASLSPSGQEEISAEGVYDDRTGHLCMVGCRWLFTNESFDCEILVKMIFPPESGMKERGFIKGSIESVRNKGDSLYFERLDFSSNSITNSVARRNIWRMDLEIIMVLISNTLACVFVGLQIWHVRKQSHMLPFISLTMLLMLTLSHMIPLLFFLLNFEALFTGHHDRQNVMLGSGGWLEVNEVFVRVVTMAAFVLEVRLFQLAWTAKFSGENEKCAWVTEIKTLFVLLPLYIIGGCIALLVNWKSNKYNTTERFNQIVGLSQQPSVSGNLRSYAGLVLDGFLFPQIFLNVFQSSKGSALSPLFYVGTTFVRSLPHAYDLYRGQNHNHTGYQFDRFYIYANPRADFYSPSWDVVIACGGILFAAIISIQQHFGGRFFLPQKFRQIEEYEMVPVSSS